MLKARPCSAHVKVSAGRPNRGSALSGEGRCARVCEFAALERVARTWGLIDDLPARVLHWGLVER